MTYHTTELDWLTGDPLGFPVNPNGSSPVPLAACCLAVIEKYRAIISPEREGTALYCKHCTSRIVLRDGVWGIETP